MGGFQIKLSLHLFQNIGLFKRYHEIGIFFFLGGGGGSLLASMGKNFIM